MYVIYALIDPRDNSVRYVGVTSNVYARFVEHINCSGSNLEKNTWMLELRAMNKMIIMETLEEAETKEIAHIREEYWIRHFFILRAHLLNRRIPLNIPDEKLPLTSKTDENYLQVALSVYLKGHTTCRALGKVLGINKDKASSLIRQLKETNLI